MVDINTQRFWRAVQRAEEFAERLKPTEGSTSPTQWVDAFVGELEMQGFRVVEASRGDQDLQRRARDILGHCPASAFATDEQVHVMHKLIEDLAR